MSTTDELRALPASDLLGLVGPSKCGVCGAWPARMTERGQRCHLCDSREWAAAHPVPLPNGKQCLDDLASIGVPGAAQKLAECWPKAWRERQRLGTLIGAGLLECYEAGTRKPGIESIILLCGALECSPNDLLLGANDPARCVQPACSPASFIAEVLRKDESAVDELKTLVPEYTPPAEYTALHARGKEALETLDEMTSLLKSAICICERQGAATNWEGFAASIRKLGLSGVTARTYRQANTPDELTLPTNPL